MKEIRFYVLSYEEIGENQHLLNQSDKEFLKAFEDNYRVYLKDGFQDEFNDGEINPMLDYIRIIEVEL
jgi:hypothetical protein